MTIEGADLNYRLLHFDDLSGERAVQEPITACIVAIPHCRIPHWSGDMITLDELRSTRCEPSIRCIILAIMNART